MFEWDHLVRCTVDSAGAWSIDFASYGLYTAPDWDAVWNRQFKELLPGRAHISRDEISKDNKGFLQAREILSGQLWDPTHNKWTIT